MSARVAWALTAALLVGCSGSGGSNAVTDAGDNADSAPDTAAPDTSAPDTQAPDVEDTAVSIEDTLIPADEIEPPPPEPAWTAIPLGAAGDLHQVRFLGEHGFVIVGQKGTILRPHGTGWVREWTPHETLTLRDVALHRGQRHAVGDDGTWLIRNETGAWDVWENTLTVNLNGLASLPDGLVAVGQNGTVFRKHETGFQYEQVEPEYHLFAIASPSNGEAFAVGTNGLVLRRGLEAGACVEAVGVLCTPCTVDLECGEGLCRTFLGGDEALCTQACDSDAACPAGMACVHQGVAPHCQPPPVVKWFTTDVAPKGTALHDVFVLDPLNVWVVGDNGFVARFSGSWAEEVSTETRDLHAVGGGAGRLYAVGESGVFLQRTAAGEWPQASELEGPLLLDERYQGVAVGGERVVAAGTDTALQIKVLPEGAFQDGIAQPAGAIRDVASTGETAVMVGDKGLVLWMNKQGYGALDSGTGADLNGVHIGGDQAMWAVGDSGTVLHLKNGGAVASFETPTVANLHGVVSLSDGTVLAVGQAGVVLRLDPGETVFVMDGSGQVQDLLDVFLDGDTPTAVGKGGTILRLNGGQWSAVPVNTSVDLHAGHSNGQQAIVVGEQGTIIHWSATGNAAVDVVDPAAVYFDVFVAQDGSATLGGWAGLLHLRDAAGDVSVLESPTPNAIYALSLYQDALLIGGASSSLWQHTGAP